jgi:hypothetical protein
MQACHGLHDLLRLAHVLTQHPLIVLRSGQQQKHGGFLHVQRLLGGRPRRWRLCLRHVLDRSVGDGVQALGDLHHDSTQFSVCQSHLSHVTNTPVHEQQ